MIHKISTAEMSREEWLAERRNSLGGSDMGAIVGLNPYSSPYSVWAEKTGRIPGAEENEAMRQGRDLEEYVAQRFTELTGKKVQRLNFLLRNDDAPHLHANIDRRVVGEHSGLECKTASALSAKKYAGGDFPEHYYVQCVSYLAVTGWDRWYLAAVVLGKSFHVYMMTTIQDDPVPEWCEGSVYVSREEIQALRDMGCNFWESYVIPDKEPPVDGTDATGEAMKLIYANTNGETIELFGREGMLEDYQQLGKRIKELQLQQDELKQIIQQDMGEAVMATSTGYKVSWKPQTRNSFQAKQFAKEHPEIDLGPYYKSSTFRTFKIEEVK